MPLIRTPRSDRHGNVSLLGGGRGLFTVVACWRHGGESAA